jgi:hypothetical protein
MFGAKQPMIASAIVSSASLVSNGVDRPLVAMAAADDLADVLVVAACSILVIDALAFSVSLPAVHLAAADTLLHIHFENAKTSLPISISASL